MKRYVFIDVDDILLDFQGKFIETLNRVFDKKIPLDSKPSQWDWSCWLNEEEMKCLGTNLLEWFHKNCPDWERNLCPSSKKTFNFLKALSYNESAYVVLLTAIPQRFSLGRVANLATYGMVYDEMYFTDGFSKADWIKTIIDRDLIRHEVIRNNLSVVFLDDRGKTCVEVATMLADLPYPSYVGSLSVPYNENAIEASFSIRNVKIDWCIDVDALYLNTLEFLDRG